MAKFDIEIETCRVDRTELDRGVSLWTCWSRKFIGPIGFVWGIESWAGDMKSVMIEVVGSYVIPFARRQGVRSAIQKEILRRPEAVIVHSIYGSKEGGEAWMRTYGYRFQRQLKVWNFIKPAKRRRKGKR